MKTYTMPPCCIARLLFFDTPLAEHLLSIGDVKLANYLCSCGSL